MYGDAGWAQGWVDGLEPFRTPCAEVIELRAAGVSESRIRKLYPPLEIGEYADSLTQQLRNRERLKQVTDIMLMSQNAELLNRMSPAKRESDGVEISGAANDLLDVIFAMPEQDRPPQFLPRVGYYLEDLSNGLGLCVEFFSSLKVLGYIAAEDADFCAATAEVDMRVNHHRIRHLVKRFTDLDHSRDDAGLLAPSPSVR